MAICWKNSSIRFCTKQEEKAFYQEVVSKWCHLFFRHNLRFPPNFSYAHRYDDDAQEKFGESLGLIQQNFRSGHFHNFYYGLSQKGDILWIFFYLVLFYEQENRIYQTNCQHIKAKIPPWESRRINQAEPRVEIREGNAILMRKGRRVAVSKQEVTSNQHSKFLVYAWMPKRQTPKSSPLVASTTIKITIL